MTEFVRLRQRFSQRTNRDHRCIGVRAAPRAGGLNQKLIQQAEPTVSPGCCGIERQPGTAGFVIQPSAIQSLLVG